MEMLIVYYSNKMSAFLACFTAAMKLNRVLRKLVGKQVVRQETFHVGRGMSGNPEHGREAFHRGSGLY